MEPVVGVGERGADLDVARGRIDDRVDGGDLALGLPALGGQLYGRAGVQARHLLLGHGEVDVDRLQGLERHDGGAGGQVLAQIDLADPEDP